MKLQQLHYNEANPRLYARLSYATTFELDIDKMGRVQIPSQLLTKYNISKDVVVIGVGDHIEVWDKQTYAAYEEKANQEFDNVAENLFKENQ